LSAPDYRFIFWWNLLFQLTNQIKKFIIRFYKLS